jgi:hypothetical protein
MGLQNGLLGVPVGLGIDLVVAPIPPVMVYAGVDSNSLLVSGHLEAQFNPLLLFWRSAWTPFIRGGYARVAFTGLADEIRDAAAPNLDDDLEAVGTGIRLAGTQMNLLSIGGGLDFLSREGFHFQIYGGRSSSVGESSGRTDEEGVVITSYQTWTGNVALGWLFL